jgi:serine phosphatase RsbU (regulator of sigma subunit)
LKLSYVFRKVANISGKCRQLIKANNTLLVASNNGLYGIEKGKSKLIIKNLYVNTIQPSKTNGIFYIGTDKGITAIKSIKNSWKEFKKIKPKDFSDAVFSIAEDEDQNIWVATGDLVYYFVIGKDLTTKSYEIFDLERESQSRISIRQIEDQTYFLSSKQIFRYITSKNKIEIDSYILSQVPSFVRFIVSQPEISWFQNGNNDWIFLGKKHKLSKFQVSLLNLFENIQTIKVDQNQNLWIIDRNNSFYKIKPTDSTETYIKDFKVYLEKIQDENGNSISLEKILIPFETKTVTFKISAPYYLRPEGIKYQYFIEEKMNSWSEWKSSPTFDFLVYPGKYKLKLRAKNIFGNISESQEYIINVKTPVWMKPWFKIALTAFSIIIIALIIILILKKRERILQRDNKRLEEKVAERTSKIIKQKEQIELKNKEITNSLNYASQIQSAILPPVKIIKDAVDECFIINKPKDIVSGDFYWAANIHGKLIVTAADCTGHGVPGAFLSLLGVTFLNEISMKIVDLQANLILEKLRARVIRSLHQQGFDKKRLDGIDLSLAIIDLKSMELQFAGANNPLYIIRNGHLTEFRGNRMPIGVQSLKIEPFTNHLIEIKKGDKVYMFSDGYTDQFGGELGKKFLSRNFKTLLEEICILPLKEQKKTLIETFELWKGRFEQIDDVLVIGLKI